MGDDRLEPPAGLVMIVDKYNTAHVLLPRGERPISGPTLCGGRKTDLAAIPHDVQDTIASPWALLTDRQFRAWPPWPCQTCVGTELRARAALAHRTDAT